MAISSNNKLMSAGEIIMCAGIRCIRSQCACVGVCVVSGHVMFLLFIVPYITTAEYGFRPHVRLRILAPALIKITKM